MNKLRMIAMCLFAMMVSSLSVKAQEVTITLFPGWNWISYPNAVSMEISEALGTFTPMNGDKIKGQFSNSSYNNGYWRGGVTHFMPGMGYMYYSSRSEVTSFVFAEASNSVVVTNIPTDITAISAVVGGTVTLAEGDHVFLRGVCWGTEPMPDVDGSYTIGTTIPGSLSDTLTELIPNTTYYVRAFVVYDHGLSYGDELSFTTDTGVLTGAINGLFSVSTSQQVYFSQGNLQYQASTSTWRFAENQWDYVGNDNTNISPTYDGWIDLFGWGTSGYNHGAICSQPWSTSLYNSDYYVYGGFNYNLYDQTGQADWGYNAISNGGNQENIWRTITSAEWNYVLNIRTTLSGIRFAKAQVNNVNGVLLLPDTWNTATFNLSNTNASGAPFSSNVINASQWIALENAGAVFLVAGGEREGTSIINAGSRGYYWLATFDPMYDALYVIFNNGSPSLYTSYGGRGYGRSVRLVRNAE